MNQSVFYTSRGRWALRIALLALGIKRGDFVALQGFTCIAVPEAILSVGAIPLFIDTTSSGLNMSVTSLRQLGRTKTIKAVIFQFTLGSNESLTDIVKYCETNEIPIIEDRCHCSFLDGDNVMRSDSVKFRFYSYEWGKPHPLGLGGHLEVADSKLLQNVEKIYNGLSPLPTSQLYKIEAQFFAFTKIYNEKLHSVFRKMFHLFSKIGVIKPNFTNVANLGYNKEENYKISKFVMRRSQNAKPLVANENKNVIASIIRDHSGYGKYFWLPNDTLDNCYRLPLIVSNKEIFTKIGSQLKIQVYSWYSTVVHPLSPSDVASLGWNIEYCHNAYRLSKHFVSLPMTREKDIRNITSILDRYYFDVKDFH